MIGSQKWRPKRKIKTSQQKKNTRLKTSTITESLSLPAGECTLMQRDKELSVTQAFSQLVILRTPIAVTTVSMETLVDSKTPTAAVTAVSMAI